MPEGKGLCDGLGISFSGIIRQALSRRMVISPQMLDVRDVTKEYPAPGQPLRVLSGVTFKLAEGESLVIMGPSGSGKSTLLNIVGALDSPTSGAVLFEDSDIHQLAPNDAARPGVD